MSNLREVKEDILKEWINFREEDLLRYVTEQNRKYVQKQLEKLDIILWIILIIGVKNILEMDL